MTGRLPGVHHLRLEFSDPALVGHGWPAVEIVGAKPGPRLAVMAGIHPNEVAGIDALLRLPNEVDPAALAGTIALLPVVNRPGYPGRAETICPVDGRNLNFTFPGRPGGSFSEALTHAILSDWAGDADCLIDLHGGDLREDMSRFTICQLIGDPGFDARNLELARAFGGDALVRLDPSHLGRPGRSCTGRAGRGQHAVFAEAGSRGALDDGEVAWHRDGVLGVAGVLGMVTPPGRRDPPPEFGGYRFLAAPVTGWCRMAARAGDRVVRGDLLAEQVGERGEPIGALRAPEAGTVLWCVRHPIVAAGDLLVGLGVDPE